MSIPKNVFVETFSCKLKIRVKGWPQLQLFVQRLKPFQQQKTSFNNKGHVCVNQILSLFWPKDVSFLIESHKNFIVRSENWDLMEMSDGSPSSFGIITCFGIFFYIFFTTAECKVHWFQLYVEMNTLKRPPELWGVKRAFVIFGWA